MNSTRAIFHLTTTVRSEYESYPTVRIFQLNFKNTKREEVRKLRESFSFLHSSLSLSLNFAAKIESFDFSPTVRIDVAGFSRRSRISGRHLQDSGSLLEGDGRLAPFLSPSLLRRSPIWRPSIFLGIPVGDEVACGGDGFYCCRSEIS
ncbi:hypothetical protein AAC387_Pa02g2567 [Persea americana]